MNKTKHYFFSPKNTTAKQPQLQGPISPLPAAPRQPANNSSLSHLSANLHSMQLFPTKQTSNTCCTEAGTEPVAGPRHLLPSGRFSLVAEKHATAVKLLDKNSNNGKTCKSLLHIRPRFLPKAFRWQTRIAIVLPKNSEERHWFDSFLLICRLLLNFLISFRLCRDNTVRDSF